MNQKDFRSFAEKTLKEIKMWAWAAAVLPLTALAAIFFCWTVGNETMLNISIASGATVMFGIAVFWWWWAIRAIGILVLHWNQSGATLNEIVDDVRAVRKIINEAIIEPISSDRQRRE